METLSKLFSSGALVKVLRLFLNNPDAIYEARDIVLRCKISPESARRELALLKSIDFVQQKEHVIKTIRGKKISRIKSTGYFLNKKFALNNALRSLLFNADPYRNDEIISKFKNIGRVKCLIVAGVYIQVEGSRIDILIVGDNLKRSAIEHALRGMEAEVGKELSYSIMETTEFKYRFGMYDKFVRDILDYPHEVLLDKLGLK